MLSLRENNRAKETIPMNEQRNDKINTIKFFIFDFLKI